MIEYRTATLDELKKILTWAAREGWNPGLDDAEAFYAADPNGFFVAVDQSDFPIAAISVVNHTEEFAFLGLYIVRPEHRGQGIGFGLWQHAIEHAGARTIGLDGVEAQQSNYVASGFVSVGSTKRFSGVVPPQAHPSIRSVAPEDIPYLIELEAKASGAAKPDYLTAWFGQAESRRTIGLWHGGRIVGVCTIRACREGAKIGPLLADTTGDALNLMSHAASLFDGPYVLDVPETSNGLAELCCQLGWSVGFKTARMYRGAFNAPAAQAFAVSSLELG